MFIFKPTIKTYSDPASATFLPGIPFGREYSRGDICLLHEGFTSSKIFLNSNVLREAILNSKDFLEDILQIKIVDKVKHEKKFDKEVEVEEMYDEQGIEVPDSPDKDSMFEEPITDKEPTTEETIVNNEEGTIVDNAEEQDNPVDESPVDDTVEDAVEEPTTEETTDVVIDEVVIQEEPTEKPKKNKK